MKQRKTSLAFIIENKRIHPFINVFRRFWMFNCLLMNVLVCFCSRSEIPSDETELKYTWIDTHFNKSDTLTVDEILDCFVSSDTSAWFNFLVERLHSQMIDVNLNGALFDWQKSGIKGRVWFSVYLPPQDIQLFSVFFDTLSRSAKVTDVLDFELGIPYSQQARDLNTLEKSYPNLLPILEKADTISNLTQWREFYSHLPLDLAHQPLLKRANGRWKLSKAEFLRERYMEQAKATSGLLSLYFKTKAFAAMGDFDKAILHLTQLKTGFNSRLFDFWMAGFEFELNNYKATIAWCNTLLVNFPYWSEANLLKAFAQIESGYLNEAAETIFLMFERNQLPPALLKDLLVDYPDFLNSEKGITLSEKLATLLVMPNSPDRPEEVP